ncbi:hypothetical protein QMQ05_13530 [Glutamicibacter ectropisis]|uniref:HTH tetR-type domain-containing protein n=1 Tax=Glutamicibacter ectropisis TaxID=3046593 RepID=A0AAU6WBH7_9MICC
MSKISSSNKSRIRLLTAVTQLLDSGAETTKITITDVVTTAGLTRPTFYATFDDLPAAFAAAALARLEDAFTGLTNDPTIPRHQQMRENFTVILMRLAEHSDFFACVLRGPGSILVQERVVEFVTSRLQAHSPLSTALAAGALPLEMTSSALAAGVTWTVIRWLDQDPQVTVPELAAQLSEYLESAVLSGLGNEPAPSGAHENTNGVVS